MNTPELENKKKTFGQSILNCVVWSVSISTFMVGSYLFAYWYAVSENGSSGILLFMHGVIFIINISMFPIFILCGLLMLVPKRTRCRGICLLLAYFIFWVMCSICFRIEDEICIHRFTKLTEQSKPLIGSIKLYEKDHGKPPSILEDLVPDYLDKVPTTGIGASPSYKYKISGDEGEGVYWDNPWELFVDLPLSVWGRDMFIYVPNQNYPDSEHYERIGDWVKLHE